MKRETMRFKFRSVVLALRRNRGSAMVMATVFVAIFAMVVAAAMLVSNYQTRSTVRSRMFNTSLAAAATLVNSMAQQASYIANTRPVQLGGSFENLGPVLSQITPTSLPGYKNVTEGGKVLSFFSTTSANNGSSSVIDDPKDDWNGFNIRRWSYEAVAFVNAESGGQTDPRASRIGFEGAGFKSRIEINYIPLYQYAIFYNNDLEFHPGEPMSVTGPVHSNSTLWAGAGPGKSLTFMDRVGAAGKFRAYKDFMNSEGNSSLRANKPGWNPESGDHTGEVSIYKRGTTNGQRLDNPSGGLDTNGNKFLESLDGNWMDKALERYQGNLKDSAMGMKTILPPLPFVEENGERKQADPSELIQRRSVNDSQGMKENKIEYLADIRITGDPSQTETVKINKKDVLRIKPDAIKIEPAIYDANGYVTGYGTPIPNQNGSANDFIVTPGSFTDYRERKTVKTFDVDMDKLRTRTATNNMIKEGNGVVYVSTNSNIDSSSQLGAVRLTNATNLPAKSPNGANTLTVASDRPMYLEGNVNTAGTKPTLLLAADAITVLTKRLTDSTGMNSDAAGSVVTNAIFMLGQVSSKYVELNADGTVKKNGRKLDHWEPGFARESWSGGAHNVLRYLEKWGGSNTHTYNGSLICLFESRIAKSIHGNQGYYSPPKRSYNWDASLKSKEPPKGMPVLVEVKISPLERISKADAKRLADAKVQ